MCKIFWAADNVMNTKEFEDIVGVIKSNICGIKMNSLYHHFQSKYPKYLCGEYSKYIDKPLFLDLKLYDTPKTITSTIEALPPFNYLTITFAHDNYMSISAAVEAASQRDAVCFVVFGLTTSKPADKQYLLSKMVYMAEIYDNIGFVIPGNQLDLIPKLKKLNSNVVTLTPGIKPIHSVSYGDQLITTSVEEIDKFGGDFGVMGRALLNN